MTKKVIFDEKLPHISLDTVDDVKHQKLKRGFGGFDSKPIDQDQFKNMLGTVVSVGSVISSRFKNTYFLMDLTTEYYSPAVSDMLDSLKLEIKTVISENQIIVKGDKDTLEEIGTQKKILKKITNPIKKMYLLDESDKLGQDLFKLIKKDVDSIKVFPIIIKLIDNINEDEEFEFKKILDDELKKEISPQYLKKTHNYICGSNSKRIIEIAKLPFIKKISKIPQIEAQNVSEDLLYSKEDYDITESSDVPSICIIDSGISEDLSSFCTQLDPYLFDTPHDTKGHGTKVSSVALFGEDILSNSKKLVQKSKLISFKIDDINATDVILDEAIMQAIDEYSDETKVFGTSVLGLVIENCRIDDHYCVNNKALLLTNFLSGNFLGRVAIRYLNYEAEIVKEISCAVIRK